MNRPAAPASLALAPILVAVFAIAILTVMDGFMKDLSTRYGTLQIAFMRFACGAAVGSVVFFALRAKAPRGEALRGYLVRGVVITVSASTFLFGLATLPIAEAVAISYIAPVLVALLAIPVLGEKPSQITFLAVLVGFAGGLVTMISGVGGGDASFLRLAGVAAVLVSALSYALSIMFLRRQATRDAPIVVALFQSLVPAAILAVPAFVTFKPVSLADGLSFLFLGALSVTGHFCLAWSYARAEASRLIATEYTGFVWAALIGIFIFAEWPTLTTYIGTALVIIACLLLRVPGRRLSLASLRLRRPPSGDGAP